MWRIGALFACVLVVAELLVWPGSPVTTLGESAVSLRASSHQIDPGQSITLMGAVDGATAHSARVSLYRRIYPSDRLRLAGSETVGSGGRFSFTRSPDEDTVYYARLSGGATTKPVVVDVDADARVTTKDVPPDRVEVSVRISHPGDFDWDHARVYWTFAPGRHARYLRVPATRTIRVDRDDDLLTTEVAMPAEYYRWRACFYAPGDHALEDRSRPARCKGQGFSGRGSVPAAFPARAAIKRAESYLANRGGHTALAVMDSRGLLYGVNLHERFITGSVVKAMLLVAYLRRLNAEGQHVIDSYSNSILYPMINVSDNDAATAVWRIVGDDGLDDLAHAAGMTDFSVPTYASWGSEWGTALLSAADQARFFFEMDSLIPKEFVGYARHLLSTIAGFESWGIPAVARPLGYTVFFKAGWRPSPDIFLVHQIARLEMGGKVFSVAVMTDGDSDMQYGIDTIQGATRALLG
jgi:hypothetical protein